MRFLLIIFSSISLNSFSQINACFTIDINKGCVPHTINVTDCSGHIGPQYFYGANPATTATTFTFSEAGNFPVIQAVDNGGVFNFDTILVTVYPIPTPITEVTNCGNNQVYLETQNLGYDYYAINWNDGTKDTLFSTYNITHTFSNNSQRNITIAGRHSPENCGSDTTIQITPFQNFEKTNIDILEVLNDTELSLKIQGQSQVFYNYIGSSTNQFISISNIFNDTMIGLNTSSDEYCYELQAINKCNTSTPVLSSKSDKVCSVVLSGSSKPGFNEISWPIYSGDNTASFDLLRNENIINSFNLNQSPHNDSNIFCSQEYIYRVEAKTNTSISISNEIEIIGKSESSPNAVSNVFSTFNESNELQITWKSNTKIPPQFYTVNSIEVTDTFLISNNINKECYAISYTDSCGNTSQTSESTCPIILDVKQNNIFEIELNWNDYEEFSNGLESYQIYIYDDKGQLIKTINNDLSTNFIFDVLSENNQVYLFQVEGISFDSLKSVSNKVQLILKNRIAMPNAFTPNGDGNNDIFIPKVRFVKDYKFAIYNKWGANIFTSNDRNEGWDGNNFPAGVYTYYVEVIDYLGETTIEKGTVTLIR